jgi:hypothetical protein
MYEHIFRVVLRLYPCGFRNEFGEESLLLLRDRWRDETGFCLRMRLLLDILFDTCRSLIRTRSRGIHFAGGIQSVSARRHSPCSSMMVRGPLHSAESFASGLALLSFQCCCRRKRCTPALYLALRCRRTHLVVLRVSHGQQPRRQNSKRHRSNLPPPASCLFGRSGRLTANASLQMLVQDAYGVQAFQVVGGPTG